MTQRAQTDPTPLTARPPGDTDTDVPSAEAMGLPVVDIVPAYADRSEHFARYAELRGSGAVEVPPHLLGRRERRLHVRNTLLEDHAVRLHDSPEAVEGKFAILAASAFSFFRGTALLYYRDHAGVDGHLPQVFSIGDVHPENFGVMPGADGRPFFAANDFDEAWVAPFTYDVHRGAVGFAMAAAAAGSKRKEQRRLVALWAGAYVEALEGFAADDSEASHRVTADTAPPVLAPAFAKAARDRGDFLAKRVDVAARRFVAQDRIEPRSDLVDLLTPVVADYAATLGPTTGPPRPEGFFTVRDVALRHGAGTASQGLGRFWVLLEGWGPDAPVIIEAKLARRSALYGLVPAHDFAAKTSAERIAYAHHEFLADGDPLYGAATIAGDSYLVRERSPQKVNIDVAAFDAEQLRDYTVVCAQALAQLHARSDFYSGVGVDGREAEQRILAAVRTDVFVSDVHEFVDEALARVHADHELFRDDLARGAFAV